MSKIEKFKAKKTDMDRSKYESQFELTRVNLLEQLLPTTVDGVALDVGCGIGQFSRNLFKKGWCIEGIDTSSSNLKNAGSLLSQAYCGDAVSILQALQEGAYDLTLCLELIEHMPRERGATLVNEIYRTLKPGGQLILSTPNRLSLDWHQGRRPQSIRSSQ